MTAALVLQPVDVEFVASRFTISPGTLVSNPWIVQALEVENVQFARLDVPAQADE